MDPSRLPFLGSLRSNPPELLNTRGSKDRHGTHTGPGVFRVARLWCVWEKLAEKVAPEQYIVGKRIAPEEKQKQNTIF